MRCKKCALHNLTFVKQFGDWRSTQEAEEVPLLRV